MNAIIDQIRPWVSDICNELCPQAAEGGVSDIACSTLNSAFAASGSLSTSVSQNMGLSGIMVGVALCFGLIIWRRTEEEVQNIQIIYHRG
jgi:hypothetical protein